MIFISFGTCHPEISVVVAKSSRVEYASEYDPIFWFSIRPEV